MGRHALHQVLRVHPARQVEGDADAGLPGGGVADDVGFHRHARRLLDVDPDRPGAADRLADAIVLQHAFGRAIGRDADGAIRVRGMHDIVVQHAHAAATAAQTDA